MPSLTGDIDNELPNPLPPVITNNLREKLGAEQVSIGGLICYKKRHDREILQIKKVILPRPLYSLEIVYLPNVLDFEIEDTKLVRRLRVWNASIRSIYIHCCGLWDESCRLGATWRCYPRTRFLLAPGLTADIYIRAAPRNFTPISSATINLQLAAGHKRDNVVRYFAVPIKVQFLKYIPPSLGEGE